METGLGVGDADRTCRRLALTRKASRILILADPDAEGKFPPEIFKEIRGRTFAVRSRDLGSRGRGIERKLGGMILKEARKRGIDASVSVSHPQTVFLVSPLGANYALSILFKKPPRSSYSKRSEARPFKQPVSIDPAIARAMINLSGVLEGEKVLDPFCGTGNILIEAGIVGARIYGMDSSDTMVEGARRNLTKLQPEKPILVRGNALRAMQIFRISFDHVVTDPPYGRASPAIMDNDQLLARFSKASYELLRPGGSVCMASPSTIDLSSHLTKAGLRVEGFAYQRIHGSLGRHLYLARKPPDQRSS